MFVLQDINSDTKFLLMRKITACFHAVNTETVSMEMEMDWVTHGSIIIIKWPLAPSLSRFKKHLSSLEPAFLLSGNIVGIASGIGLAAL